MAIGKKVFDDVYVHVNLFPELCRRVNNPFVAEISTFISSNRSTTFNVVKVNLK